MRRAFRWVDNDFQSKSYDDYKALEQKNVEAVEHLFEVTAFFEQVGFLVEKKFVDFEVVQDRLRQGVISNWQKLEPWVLALRKAKNDYAFGEHFQRLYERTVNDVKKR